ncbi:MAG: DNA cytosine methyltransferase [Candidatus Hydrogenedentes bacterium]|nr:DNA cytosine methyltransferase [Candidatus Hydrogenedentota bacterium]MBI3119616.1 DNA cytosine methyltransferase [Candidatus Hydrogenedentota bacterium]
MGLDLGIESAGFEIIGCLEADKWACATIRANKPAIPLIEDTIVNWTGAKVLEFLARQREEVDLIIGGPPCPSFSTAGKRQSFTDPRGQVMFDFLRLVEEIRPPFFVMENVRGILSASLKHRPLLDRVHTSPAFSSEEQKGSVMRLLHRRFSEMGYVVTVELTNAAHYGVPQNRERVVFIGSRDGFQVTLPLPSHSSNGNGFCLPYRTLGGALEGLKDPRPQFMPFSESRLRFFRMLKAGQNWRDLPPEVAREALGGAFASGGGKVGFFRRLSYDKPCPTVPTSPIQKSTALCHPTALRPLSVREYARVQQFPDDWKFIGSISRQYQQIGNAVPVGLGHVVGRSILRYLENLAEF